MPNPLTALPSSLTLVGLLPKHSLRNDIVSSYYCFSGKGEKHAVETGWTYRIELRFALQIVNCSEIQERTKSNFCVLCIDAMEMMRNLQERKKRMYSKGRSRAMWDADKCKATSHSVEIMTDFRVSYVGKKIPQIPNHHMLRGMAPAKNSWYTRRVFWPVLNFGAPYIARSSIPLATCITDVEDDDGAWPSWRFSVIIRVRKTSIGVVK